MLDQVFRQFLVFGFQRLKIAPVVGIEEVHEIEQLADVVVERSLHTRELEIYAVSLALTPVKMMRWTVFSSFNFLKI